MRMRILLLAMMAMLLAACGDDGGTDTTVAPGEGSSTTSAPATMSGVHVGDTEAGSVLVGPDGLTLYVFTSDTGGVSTCYDACADVWPSVPGDTEIGGDLDASMFATTTRDDGTEQLMVNDMPLYWYEPDEEPGDAKGQGVDGVWFVVDVEGAIIEASAGADVSSDDTIDYDYGYGG